jgi:hypothetical protein
MEDHVPPEPSLPPLRRRPITGTKRRRHRRPPPPPTATDWLNHHTDPQHKGDLSSTLEHLMAVGLKEQRDAQRYHQFPLPPPTAFRQGDRGSESDNDNDEEEEGTTTTRTRGNKLSALKEAFVEDIRLYGETETFKYDGLERSPWPCSKRVRSAAAATTGGTTTTTTTTSKVGSSLARKNETLDEPWELEYGDSIHPLAFSSARLSSTQMATTTLSSAEECDAINGTNLNVATTETSLSEREVPRALLLRCWQRAVDAASQGALVTVGVEAMERITNTTTTTNLEEAEQDVSSRHLFGGSILGLVDSTLDHAAGPSIPPPRAVKEPPFAAAQRVLAQDTFRTKRKCTSMGLGLTRAQLPMDVSKGTCPACYRPFAQLKDLQHHYFGDRDVQRGCCWRRITQKEPRIVADVLENHVKAQIDQYLGLVMDQAFQTTLATSGGDDDDSTSRKMFTWYDILKFTEEAVVHSSSHSVETSTTDPRNGIHPMFETFQRKSDSDYPLVLNPTVLRNARKRLMDRYANVPR